MLATLQVPQHRGEWIASAAASPSSGAAAAPAVASSKVTDATHALVRIAWSNKTWLVSRHIARRIDVILGGDDPAAVCPATMSETAALAAARAEHIRHFGALTGPHALRGITPAHFASTSSTLPEPASDASLVMASIS